MPLPNVRTARLRSVLVLLALLSLTLSGCIEKSIVVKVLKDGSALIHVRTFAMPAPFSLGSSEKKEELKQEGVGAIPLSALLEELGPGVSVKSNEKSTNARGWTGTELILKCEDINTLRITPKAFSLLMAADSSTSDKQTAKTEGNQRPEDSQFSMDFGLKEDQLAINIDWTFPESESVSRERAQDPFADSPQSVSPIAMALTATVVRELRVGVFVETEREIAESNASNPIRNKTLVTILRLDGAKVDVEKLYELGVNRPKSQEEYGELAENFDGFSVETNSKVTLKLK